MDILDKLEGLSPNKVESRLRIMLEHYYGDDWEAQYKAILEIMELAEERNFNEDILMAIHNKLEDIEAVI